MKASVNMFTDSVSTTARTEFWWGNLLENRKWERRKTMYLPKTICHHGIWAKVLRTGFIIRGLEPSGYATVLSVTCWGF